MKKTKMIRGLFIDAKNKCVQDVEVSKTDGLTQLQEMVEGYIEAVRLPNGDTLYVNEEGLLKDFSYGFMLLGHEYRGNGAIVGPPDDNGDETDAKTTRAMLERAMRMQVNA